MHAILSASWPAAPSSWFRRSAQDSETRRRTSSATRTLSWGHPAAVGGPCRCEGPRAPSSRHLTSPHERPSLISCRLPGHDAHAMSERGVDSSARRADDGFDMVAIRVDDERRVIVRTIVRPKARGALVPGAVRDRRRVESVDGVSARRGEGQMETRARSSLRSRPLLYRELIAFAGLAVADLLGRALGRKISPNPDESKRREDGVVEGAGALDILYTERYVMEHRRPTVAAISASLPSPGSSANRSHTPWRG